MSFEPKAIDFAKITRKMARDAVRAGERPRVVIDFETRSICDLKDCGAAVYAEHPSTKILCMSWAIGDEEPSLWWPFFNEEFPEALREAIKKNYVFEAHNSQFERAIWRNLVMEQYGVEMPKVWEDTQAACAYRAIPLNLDDATRVLGLAETKSKRGKALIQKLCKPQKLLKKDLKEGKTFPNWCEDPVLLEELGDYCKQDVRAERALGNALGNLPDDEYEVWWMDQEINERGVYIDINAVRAAEHIRANVEVRLVAELKKITDEQVTSGSEIAKIVAWLHGKGCHLDDLTADTVDETLARFKANGVDEQDPCYRVIKIRQTLSRASAKKLAKFISMLCRDGRIRGLLAYHGAATGRWAGRGLQPQNFPRPDESLLDFILDAKGKPDAERGMELLISVIMEADAEMLEAMYGDPMNAIASSLRGFIIAEPENELYVADFSAIEARVLAWVAGEQWKLDAFAAIDRKEGYKGSEDIYLATASSVYGYPCLSKTTHKAERQTGKTCELAFGYQGGVGAWRKFDDSDKWTDEEVDEKKVAWRESHKNITSFWYNIEETAINAVRLRTPCTYRGITFQVVKSAVGDWLACRLPNKRCLWYYKPHVVEVVKFGKPRLELRYQGKDNKKGGAWGVISTYGGMLTENIVQAISRDLMVAAMFSVRKWGYPIVLTVHDEIIAERLRNSGGSLKQFYDLISIVPPWAKGLPIAVDGFIGPRYRK